MNSEVKKVEKNPYQYNGDYTLIDNETNSNNLLEKNLYIESYGCAMNFSDSEIVASVLSKKGYRTTHTITNADLILLNTCSIREKAEETIRKRLKTFNSIKKINKQVKIGILGCMAERLKDKLIEEEKIVDLVVGPDSYKDLPNLLDEVEKVCSHVVILRKGEKLYSGRVDGMLASHGFFELKSDDLSVLKSYLEKNASFGEVKIENGMLTAFLKEEMNALELNQTLFSQGIVLSHLVKRKESLEEQFLALTKNS